MPTRQTIRHLTAIADDPRGDPATRKAAKLKLKQFKRSYPELFAPSAQPPSRQGEILPRYVGGVLTLAIVSRRQHFTYGYQIIHNRTGDVLADDRFKTFGSVDEAKEAGWHEAAITAVKLRGRA
jgi:hypothetical protein